MYVANLTGNVTRPGRVDYSVDIKFEDGWCTYPLGLKGKSTDWDNNYNGNFTIDFVEEGVPLVLWDAVSDWDNSIIQWNKGIRIGLNPRTGEPALCYHLKEEDENTDADIQGTTDLLNTFKFYFKDGRNEPLDLNALETLQISVVSGTKGDAKFYLSNVRLD